MYYNGSAIAQMVTNLATSTTSVEYLPTGYKLSYTAPLNLGANQSYSPLSGVTATVNSDCSAINVTGNQGTGYSSLSVDSNNYYNTAVYHPKLWQAPQMYVSPFKDPNGGGGGSGGCSLIGKTACPIKYACVYAIMLAAANAAFLAAAVCAAVANPVFGVLEAAGLVGGHLLTAAAIVDAYKECA